MTCKTVKVKDIPETKYVYIYDIDLARFTAYLT